MRKIRVRTALLSLALQCGLVQGQLPGISVQPTCKVSQNGLWYVPAPMSCTEIDQSQRCWYTYTPEKAIKSLATAPSNQGEVPLVIDMHGYKGCAQWSPLYTGWKDLATEEGFVVVWPQGTIEQGDLFSHTCWDAGEGCCCHRFARKQVNDVGFIRQLIADVVATSEAPIDTRRIYLAGHSNGCMMAQRIALEAPDIVAAVACHAGVLAVDTPPVSDPIPVMTIFGDADEVLPYAGGGQDGLPGAMESMQRWAGFNGCIDTYNSAWSQDYAEHRWEQCDADVELVQVFAAGHFPYKDAAKLLQEGTRVDTTTLAWEFCKHHSKEAEPDLPPCSNC